MATSGVANFSVTRDEVIRAALRLLKVIGVGESPDSEDYNNCSEALNMMIKSWQKKGAALWVYSELTLPLVEGVTTYAIGPDGGVVGLIEVTDGGSGYTSAPTVTISGGSPTTNATATATVSGGEVTAITITNDGAGYETTPTVSFSGGGGAGAAATAYVAGLTTVRPSRVLDAFLRNSDDIDVPIIPISRQQYDMLGNKSFEGIVNQYYFNPQLDNAQITFYNVPEDSTYEAHLIVQRPFYDMNSSSDTFDFPQEAFQALKWGLADEVGLEYVQDQGQLDRIQAKAEKFAAELFDWSVEEVEVLFRPDPQGTYRNRG